MLTVEDLDNSARETIRKMKEGVYYRLSPSRRIVTDQASNAIRNDGPMLKAEAFIRHGDLFQFWWGAGLKFESTVSMFSMQEFANNPKLQGYHYPVIVGFMYAIITGELTEGFDVQPGNIPLKFSHLNPKHPDYDPRTAISDVYLID